MEKLFHVKLDEEIKSKADKNPVSISFTEYEEVLQNERLREVNRDLIAEVELWLFTKTLYGFNGYSGTYKQEKNRRRFLMLMGRGVFVRTVAKDLAIKMKDIIQNISLLHHYQTYLNTREQEWIDDLKEKAKELYDTELRETNNFYESYKNAGGSSFLRKLIKQNSFYEDNVPTRTVVKNELQRVSANINKVREKMATLISASESNQISESKLASEVKNVKDKLRLELGHRNYFSSKYLLDKESSERMYFVNAFPSIMNSSITLKGIRIVSKTQGSILLNDYVKWYNIKYKDEITAARKAIRVKKDRARYNTRPDVIERKAKRKMRRESFFNLINDGKTQSEAAKTIGISVSTASNWVKENNKQ